MKHRPADIVAAAVVVFDADGVAASTSRLARAAGVSNGTLFNYFATKQDLIDAVYIQLKSELAEAIGTLDPEASIEDNARSVWDRWYTWATTHPVHNRVMHLLHQSRLASEAAVARADSLLAEPLRLVHDGVSAGVFVDLPASYISGLIQVLLDLAVEHRLRPDQQTIAFHAFWHSVTASAPTP